MSSIVTRIVTVAAASVGMAVAGASAASAAASGQPSSSVDGLVAGIMALPVSTDPVATLTGGAIDPLSNSVGTELGNLPVSTSMVSAPLRTDGDLGSSL